MFFIKKYVVIMSLNRLTFFYLKMSQDVYVKLPDECGNPCRW